MQKALIVAVIVIVVAAGGLFFFMKKDAKAPSGAENVTEKVAELGTKAEESKVVGSIKDAMGLNKRMVCTYTDPSGKTPYSATTYIEGKKFKSEANINGVVSHVVSDGETQYMWTDGQKQGFKMTSTCLDDLKDSLKDLPANVPKPQDYEDSFDMAQNVKCEDTGAIDFSLPSDVTFADQCAMMKQNMEMLKKVPGQMPQTMPAPAAY